MFPEGPRPSAYLLVECPPSADNFHTYWNPVSDIEVTTTYSEEDSRYISQGWTTGALTAGAPQ